MGRAKKEVIKTEEIKAEGRTTQCSRCKRRFSIATALTKGGKAFCPECWEIINNPNAKRDDIEDPIATNLAEIDNLLRTIDYEEDVNLYMARINRQIKALQSRYGWTFSDIRMSIEYYILKRQEGDYLGNGDIIKNFTIVMENIYPAAKKDYIEQKRRQKIAEANAEKSKAAYSSPGEFVPVSMEALALKNKIDLERQRDRIYGKERDITGITE